MVDAQICEVSVNSKVIYFCTLKQYVVTDITSFVKVIFYRVGRVVFRGAESLITGLRYNLGNLAPLSKTPHL